MARSTVDGDETVQFFPTLGWRDGEGWRVRVHGWIYEPVDYSRMRRAALWLARRILKRRVGPAENDGHLRTRLAAFFTDNERGERVRVLCAGREFVMNRSRADGHFEGTITLGDAEVAAAAPGGGRWIDFTARLRAGDTRSFAGRALLLEAQGVSVISDIDDTIKHTGALERRTMLRSTFCEAFASVPGMADFYARLRERHRAAFHYVSGSPWQLYPFLAEGLSAAGFPQGTFHLRNLRFKGRSLLGALASSARIKRRHLNELFTRFPQRRFILVGDSGERDGELYAALARQFPAQVLAIYIRDTGAAVKPWKEVFHKLENWFVFQDPARAGTHPRNPDSLHH